MQIAQAKDIAAMGGVTGYRCREAAPGRWEIEILGRREARTLHTAQGAVKTFATIDAALRDIRRIATRPLPTIELQPL